mmetsp:Transcript_8164/g.17844  ORF Transcript_8164/g.17844 Transcript_8164/m.17844 type:complete len:253 (+) Transcript_8164:704-1462(+)
MILKKATATLGMCSDKFGENALAARSTGASRVEDRAAESSEASDDPALVHRRQLDAQQVPSRLVEKDALAVAEEEAVYAQLARAWPALDIAALHQHRLEGRWPDTFHEYVPCALGGRHPKERRLELVVKEVVAAALALRFEDEVVRLGARRLDRRLHFGAALLVQAVELREARAKHGRVLGRHETVQLSFRRQHLLHLLGARQVLTHRRALDCVRALDERAPLPLCFARVVVGSVARAEVNDRGLERAVVQT